MNRFIKKVLVSALSATMLLGSVTTAFAATSSVTTAPQPVKQTDAVSKTESGLKVTVDTKASGKAAVTEIAKTNKKTVKVDAKVEVDGVKYTVTSIEANAFENAAKATKISLPSTITKIGADAFAGCDNVKTIVITSNSTVKVNKDAFGGVDTSKMTIKVTVSKTGMSNAEYKAFVKSLKKAGFKGTIKKVK